MAELGPGLFRSTVALSEPADLEHRAAPGAVTQQTPTQSCLSPPDYSTVNYREQEKNRSLAFNTPDFKLCHSACSGQHCSALYQSFPDKTMRAIFSK